MLDDLDVPLGTEMAAPNAARIFHALYPEFDLRRVDGTSHIVVPRGTPWLTGTATLPSATPKVQVERPQRSEDERPGGAARRRTHSAAGKARGQGSPVKPQRPKGTSQAAKKAEGAP